MVNGFKPKSSQESPRNKKDFRNKGQKNANYKNGSMSNFLNVSSTSKWGVTELKFDATDKAKPAVSTAQWNISEVQRIQTPNDIFSNVSLDDSNSCAGGPENTDNPKARKPKKLSAYKRAMETFKTKKEKAAEERRAHAQQLLAKKQKKEGDIEKRKANFKIFSKKNKYGQPVMAGRIQQMLERIQGSN